MDSNATTIYNSLNNNNNNMNDIKNNVHKQVL